MINVKQLSNNELHAIKLHELLHSLFTGHLNDLYFECEKELNERWNKAVNHQIKIFCSNLPENKTSADIPDALKNRPEAIYMKLLK